MGVLPGSSGPVEGIVRSGAFIVTDLYLCSIATGPRAREDCKNTIQEAAEERPKRGEPTARERLVETACELFYSEGRTRGRHRYSRSSAAGVSKSSLYRTFESKDALIAASAGRMEPSLLAVVGMASSMRIRVRPRAKLDALFKGPRCADIDPPVSGAARSPTSFTEISDRKPSRQRDSRAPNKQEVRRRLRARSAGELGVRDPRPARRSAGR